MKLTQKALRAIAEALRAEVMWADRATHEAQYAARVTRMLRHLAAEDPTISEEKFIADCYPPRLKEWARPRAVYRVQVRDEPESWWSRRSRFVSRHAAIHFAQTDCRYWDRVRVIDGVGTVAWTKRRTRVTTRGAAA